MVSSSETDEDWKKQGQSQRQRQILTFENTRQETAGGNSL